MVVHTRDPLESVAATTRTSIVLKLPIHQELPSTEVRSRSWFCSCDFCVICSQVCNISWLLVLDHWMWASFILLTWTNPLCLLQVIPSETNVSVEGSEQKLPITRQGRSKSRKLLESSRRARDSSLLEYHLPRRSVTVFETDRLVPTGPNPFHNSNTTEVWYPWYCSCKA